MTREKILDATLQLIKTEGIDGVTIRKIACDAGTNVALINYYFGSKDKLLLEAIKIQLETFQAAFQVFEQLELPPIERLKKFIHAYTAHLLEYPDLIKRLLGHDPLFESVAEYFQFMKNQGFEKLSAVMMEITQETNRERIMLMVQQMFAAIMSPFIKPHSAHKCKSEGVAGQHSYFSSISNEERIDLFFEHYFHKYTITT